MVERADGDLEQVVIMSFFRTRCSSPNFSYMIYRPSREMGSQFEWVGYVADNANIRYEGIIKLIGTIRSVVPEQYDPAPVSVFFVLLIDWS